MNKVAIFFHRDVHGVRDGTAMLVRRLSSELSKYFEVSLFVYTDFRHLRRIRGDGYWTYMVPRVRFPFSDRFLESSEWRKIFYSLMAFHPRIYFVSKRIVNPDIVFCIDSYCGFVAGVLSRVEGRKLAFRANDCIRSLAAQTIRFSRVTGLILLIYSFIIERLVSQISDIIFVPSRVMKSLFEMYYGAFGKIFVSPPGSEEAHPEYSYSVRAKYGVSEDQPFLLFLGSADWFPNRLSIKYIIDKLAPFLEREIPEATIMILGRGTEEFRGSAKSSSNVVVVGEVENLGPYLGSVDLALAPSVVMGGVSAKIIEYFCSGLPVVATKEAAETIDQQIGVIKSDLGSFHLAVAEAVKEIGYWRVNRVKIIEEAKRKFSWKKVGETVAIRLNSLLNENGLRV